MVWQCTMALMLWLDLVSDDDDDDDDDDGMAVHRGT
jgi:hypothetical protein